MRKTKLLLLDLKKRKDSSLFRQYWEISSERKPHYNPDYVRLMADANEYPMAIFYQHSKGGIILYPILVRSLDDLSFCPRYLKSYKDVRSPYGYGGPLYLGSEDAKAEICNDFRIEYSKFAYSQKFVSEFIREDIFANQLVILDGYRIEQQKNVVVRLTRSKKEIWFQYEHKVRKNVKRAIKERLKFVLDPQGIYLDDFLKIYYSTMYRTGASSYFFFPKKLFKNFIKALGPGEGLTFVHVFDDDKMVATELILMSNTVLYSFLGGTSDEGKRKRANDFLKHKTILWGKLIGKKYYVLGGGASPGDGIFRYKKSFDPKSIFPFYVNMRIINEEVYNDILSEYKKYTKNSTTKGFFPPYRV